MHKTLKAARHKAWEVAHKLGLLVNGRFRVGKKLDTNTKQKNSKEFCRGKKWEF